MTLEVFDPPPSANRQARLLDLPAISHRSITGGEPPDLEKELNDVLELF
jgi:hypothetical protein